MSRVDDELRAALQQEDEPARATELEPVASPAREEPRSRGSVGLLIGLLLIGGLVLALVFTTLKGSEVYSQSVDQLLAERSKVQGGAEEERFLARKYRVEGVLVKGSLTRRDQPCEYRFRLTKNEREIAVRYAQCVVPDTFRDVPNMDVNVTAEGRLSPEGHFEAAKIMAKCPSKYEMRQRQQNGESAPHAAVTSGS